MSAAHRKDSKWASLLRDLVPTAHDYCSLLQVGEADDVKEAIEHGEVRDEPPAQMSDDQAFWSKVVSKGETTLERVRLTLNILIQKSGFTANDDSLDRDKPVKRFQDLARSANVLDVLMAMIMAPLTCPCEALQNVELWAAEKEHRRAAVQENPTISLGSDGTMPSWLQDMADTLKPIHDLLYFSFSCLIKDNREAEIYVAEHYGVSRYPSEKSGFRTPTKHGGEHAAFDKEKAIGSLKWPWCSLTGSLNEPTSGFAWPFSEEDVDQCDVLTWIALIIKQAVRYCSFFLPACDHLHAAWTRAVFSSSSARHSQYPPVKQREAS